MSIFYSVYMDITFVFIAENDKSAMVKCKGHPGEALHYIVKITPALCKDAD